MQKIRVRVDIWAQKWDEGDKLDLGGTNFGPILLIPEQKCNC